MTNEEFIKQLKHIRFINDCTQYGLTYKMGMPREYFPQVERGKREMTIPEFLKFCEFFNLSPRDFFEEKYPWETVEKRKLYKKIEDLSPRDRHLVEKFVESIYLRDHITRAF